MPFIHENKLYLGYVILGDSAYPTNDVMVSIFKGRTRPPESQLFNQTISPVRTCVEWGYEKIVKYWAFVDFKKQMKVGLTCIEPMWHLAVFFTNALQCAHRGNQISDYFDLPPPTLGEFLDNVLLE
jgi:hypothetical protein